MAKIEISTFINNTPGVVFDLSRNIDLHRISTTKTKEEAIDGVTFGLIKMDEFVTWEAYHLFKKRRFTSKIVQYDRPFSFTDQMIQGDLKSFSHHHSFEPKENGTLMKDIVFLNAPFGIAGKLIMRLFLKNYFKNFLLERNALIKIYAETDQWKSVSDQA